MTNPTIQKTWSNFSVNNYSPINTARGSTNAHFDRRQTLLGIKDAFKGFTTGGFGWVVQGSSNVSGAGTTDLVDRWADEDDLIWRDDDTGSNFSWIVLRQTGISAKFELLICCEQDSNSNDGAQLRILVGQSGFNAVDGGTDGTISSRPTASDERQILNSTGQNWGSGASGSPNLNIRWHAQQSTDGQCTRVFLFMNGVNTGFWCFEKPDNPATGWTDPYFAAVKGDNDSTTNQCTYAKMLDAAGASGRYSGADTTIFLSSEGFNNSAIGELLITPNQLNNTFVASEMGVASETSTFIGRMGTVFDMWWGFTFAGSARYYPEDGSKLYVQISHMIFPWDGSTLMQIK